MSGFENFIYMFGAVAFALSIGLTVLWLVDLIERPVKRR